MAKKKISTSLINSPGKTLDVKKKEAKKSGKADSLHPKVENKSSMTDNIKKKSGKSIIESQLGKSKSVPLSQKLQKPKKK